MQVHMLIRDFMEASVTRIQMNIVHRRFRHQTNVEYSLILCIVCLKLKWEGLF